MVLVSLVTPILDLKGTDVDLSIHRDLARDSRAVVLGLWSSDVRIDVRDELRVISSHSRSLQGLVTQGRTADTCSIKFRVRCVSREKSEST